MNCYFYLWLLKILWPENTSSWRVEFITEQGRRVNWFSGSLNSRVTGSLGHKMWPSSMSVCNWLTADHVQHFAATAFLCCSGCVQSIMGFLYGRCERLFVRKITNKYFTRQIFYKRFLNGQVLHGNLGFQFLLEHGHFYTHVANLPLSVPVKEFWKSVNIWVSYGQEFSVLFFDSRCTYNIKITGHFTAQSALSSRLVS